MTPEIKDFKTWAEAELWLARHGWGTALIEQQKELWEAANAVEKVAKATTTTKATESNKTASTK